MPHERFFADQSFSKDRIITLTEKEHHHLSRVMRVKEEKIVELVNGQGKLAKASVIATEKRATKLKILSVLSISQTPPRIILIQAIPKLSRLDFIVEKGTELGMAGLKLFPAEKSERASLTKSQLLRLQGISISAMKQCGRLFLPKIELLPSLSSWEFFPTKAYFGDLSTEAPPFLSVCKALEDSVCLFIGPESGFTETELQILRSHEVLGVRLHPNILRTDTASMTAIALISHFSMIV